MKDLQEKLGSKTKAEKIFITIVLGLFIIGVIGLMSSLFVNGSSGGKHNNTSDSGNNGDTGTDVVPESKDNTLTFTNFNGEGVTCSANVYTYDYLWTSVVKEEENDVFEIGKNAYSASSQLVWLELEDSEAPEDCNVYTFETKFKWSGNKNGVSGASDPTWYYRFSLSDVSGDKNVDFLNLWFCSSQNENVFALVGSTQATVNDYLTVLNTNQWYKLTIKYYATENYATIFIDDNSVGFINSVSPDLDSVCGAFEVENRGKCRDSIIYLDDVSFKASK